MAAVAAALGLHPRDPSKSGGRLRFRTFLRSNPAPCGGVYFLDPPGRWRGLPPRPCCSFRSENGGGKPCKEKTGERPKGVVSEEECAGLPERRKGELYSLKSLIVRISGVRSRYEGQYKKAMQKAEALFFALPDSLLTPFMTPFPLSLKLLA